MASRDGAPAAEPLPPPPPSTAPAAASPGPLVAAVGGLRGLADSSLPTLVFVVAVTFGALRTAVLLAVAAGAALGVLRLARREPVRYVLSGFVAVVVSAVVALRLGKAEGFFLPGIAMSAAYGAAFLGSILVRRPLVGVLAAAFGWPLRSRSTANLLTALWAAVFLLRAGAQGVAYLSGEAGWLAALRIGMGWPLTALAFAISAGAARRGSPAPVRTVSG